MDAPRPRTHLSQTVAKPREVGTRAAANAELRVVSDLSPDIPVTERELDLLALLLGDRLREILEDDS